MSKFIQLCLLLALFNTNLIGQRVSFEIVGKVGYMNDQSYQTVREFDATSHLVLNDTMYLRTRGVIRSVNLTTYSAKLGYEIQGRVTISLSERFSLRTGLGLNYTAFSIGKESMGFEWISTTQDTIERVAGTGIGGGISLCDVYDNSSVDVGDINRDLQNQIINLTIPLELGFEVIPGKLRTHVGVFFQTPVLTISKNESLILKREMMNGEYRCRFEKIENENRSGDGFNNLQFGLSASVQYEFFKGIGVEIGVSKAMSSVFVNEVYQSTFSRNGVFKPFIISAGFSYKFGQGTMSEE